MGGAAPGGAAAPQKETAPPDVISSEDAIAFFLSGVCRGAQEKPGAAVTRDHRVPRDGCGFLRCGERRAGTGRSAARRKKTKKALSGLPPQDAVALLFGVIIPHFFRLSRGERKIFRRGGRCTAETAAAQGVGMRAETPPPARKGERQQGERGRVRKGGSAAMGGERGEDRMGAREGGGGGGSGSGAGQRRQNGAAAFRAGCAGDAVSRKNAGMRAQAAKNFRNRLTKAPAYAII